MTPLGGGALLDRLDPRTRVLAALAFSVVAALSRSFEVLGGCLALAALLAAAAGIGPAFALRRLLPVNLFMLLLWLLLPLSTPGEPLFRVGPLAWSGPGLRLAGAITLKGNAIVLALAALLGKLETVELGHALHHLKVPDKLAHLFLFTVRYVELIGRESRRLSQAMRARAFRPGMNLHTYRSYGYFAGMLLVRSFERSERVLEAMKCRGFRGRFYVLDHFAFGRPDLLFGLFLAAVLSAMVWVQW